MTEYILRGLTLCIPDAFLGGNLPAKLASAEYEHTEADALARHLVPGDRMIDLGAGAGYLCCLAARTLGPSAVAGVEAHAGMAQVARANLARNGFAGVEIADGALVGPRHRGPTVRFGERSSFWASALAPAEPETPKGLRVRIVPALKLRPLLKRLAPTVIVCDIEGAEADVLDGPLVPELRLIVVELHPKLYGLDGVRRVFDTLSRRGFGYQPHGSQGATVVFQRVTPG